MTTRKPKLNLLYATDSSMPWLQLAVVTTEPNASQHHARHWQSVLLSRPAIEGCFEEALNRRAAKNSQERDA